MIQKQPREFTDPYHYIIPHLNSNYHAQKLQQFKKTNEIFKSNAPRNYKAGLMAKMNAYKAIHTNCSQTYEFENALDSAKSFSGPELNVGRLFAADMTHHFYTELHDEFQRQAKQPMPGTGRQSPISLTLDTYTPNRRTLDITAGNIYLQGKIENVFLDAPIVKNHTGLGIAKSVYNAACKVYGGTGWT